MKSDNDDDLMQKQTPDAEHDEPATAVYRDLVDLSEQLIRATGREPREIEAVAASLANVGFAVPAQNLEEIAQVVHASTRWFPTSALFLEHTKSADASLCGGMTLREVHGRKCIYVVLRRGHAELTLHAGMDDLLTAWPSFRELFSRVFPHVPRDADARGG